MELIKPFLVVVGAPNTGKTTLVEALETRGQFDVQDTEGTHVLGANTDEDLKLYNLLLGRAGINPPDAIVVLLSATQLHDHLYLAGQVLDLRLPTLIGVTYSEDEEAQVRVDEVRLETMLSVPVFRISRSDEENLRAIEEKLHALLTAKVKIKAGHWQPSLALANAYNHLDRTWSHKHLRLHPGARLIEGLRLISSDKAIEGYEGHPAFNALKRTLTEAREKMEVQNQSWQMGEAAQKYQWAGRVATAVLKREPATPPPDQMPPWKKRLSSTPAWVGVLLIILAALIALAGVLYL